MSVSARQVWFRIHWFIGITAGSILVVIGLSGATLAFRDELTDWIDPGIRQVPVRSTRGLSPQQILEAMTQTQADRRIASITVFAKAGAAARVTFAPPAGQRRGESILVDPYDGVTRPPLRAYAWFEWVESLHRWLLLPHETGRVVAGMLAACLLAMAGSGLYLRWPRRPLDWRHWLTFDSALRGRPFLKSLHSTWGTWVLVLYLVSTCTGLYWTFDFVKSMVDATVGATVGTSTRAEPAPPRGRPGPAESGKDADGERRRMAPDARARSAIDLRFAWTAFEDHAGPWQQATLRIPEHASQPVQITWLAVDAPHERARNRMSVGLLGEIVQDERYRQLPLGARLVTLAYPVHTGTYFGVPGRLVMMLSALSLPGFAVTGWMMYLRRRRLRAAQVSRMRT